MLRVELSNHWSTSTIIAAVDTKLTPNAAVELVEFEAGVVEFEAGIVELEAGVVLLLVPLFTAGAGLHNPLLSNPLGHFTTTPSFLSPLI